MTEAHLTATGVYPTSTQAEVAVNMLIESGFNSDKIHLNLPKQRNTKYSVGQPLSGDVNPRKSKTSSVTALAATIGAVLFGALGLLAGSGAFDKAGSIPAGGSGPLVSGLVGLLVGAISCALIGNAVGRHLQADRTHRHVSGSQSGPTVLNIICESQDDLDKARAALARAGAQDIS